MPKSRYDQLCDELESRRADQCRQLQLAESVAAKFRVSFAHFLGVDDEQNGLVNLMRVKLDGDKVVPVSNGEQSPAQSYVLPDENHNHDWVFVIELKTPLHLQDFVIPCFIKQNKEEVSVRVAGRECLFAINPNDLASYEPAVAALYEHLIMLLRWRPGTGTTKPPMGFDLT